MYACILINPWVFHKLKTILLTNRKTDKHKSKYYSHQPTVDIIIIVIVTVIKFQYSQYSVTRQ